MQEQQKSTKEQKSETFTPEIIKELKSFLVERMVDNMSLKDLVIYVTDDMQQWIDKLTFNDALVEIEEYFDEYFTETIEEVIDNVK